MSRVPTRQSLWCLVVAPIPEGASVARTVADALPSEERISTVRSTGDGEAHWSGASENPLTVSPPSCGAAKVSESRVSVGR
jgi:hypothetical protein